MKGWLRPVADTHSGSACGAIRDAGTLCPPSAISIPENEERSRAKRDRRRTPQEQAVTPQQEHEAEGGEDDFGGLPSGHAPTVNAIAAVAHSAVTMMKGMFLLHSWV